MRRERSTLVDAPFTDEEAGTDCVLCDQGDAVGCEQESVERSEGRIKCAEILDLQ